MFFFGFSFFKSLPYRARSGLVYCCVLPRVNCVSSCRRIWSISSGLWLILVSIGLCFGAARQCKATLVSRSFLGVEAIRVSSFVYALSLSLPFLAIYSAFMLDGRA